MRRVLLSTDPQGHLAPEGARVLTPNPRAARVLQVPFVSVEGLARRFLGRRGVTLAGEVARRRALRRAVEEVLRPSDVVGHARAASGPVAEILRAGYPHRQPSRLATDSRAQNLLELVLCYRDHLGGAQLLDPAEALWAAAELEPAPQRLAVLGYPRFGPAEIAFLQAASAEGSVVVLPTGSHTCFSLAHANAETLQQAGWVGSGEKRHGFERAELSVAERVAVAACRFATLEDEVRHALTEVKRLLHGGVDPEQVVLVVRDEALYTDVLRDVAWEYELPLRTASSLPLRRTELGAWLESFVAVLRDDFPFEAGARLLRHRLSEALSAEMWQEARLERPQGRAAWARFVPALGELGWPEAGSSAAFATAFGRAIEALGVRARAEIATDSRHALYKVLSALDDFGAGPDDEITPAAFVDDFTDLLRLLTVPTDLTTRGVEVHTPLALFGTSYAHVFVLGLAEGVLPAPLRDDPLLGYAEKAELSLSGLPLEVAADAARRETLSFWAAARSARERLYLSYPERTGGAERLASPYFGLLGLSPRGAPRKPPASREEWLQHSLGFGGEGADTHSQQARHALEVETRRESAAPADVYDGVIGVPLDPQETPLSVRELLALGSCPFRYFAGSLLRLAEPDERSDTLGAGVRGQLYHETLRRALSRDAAGSVQPETLESAFGDAEASLGLDSLPGWARQRSEHLAALRRVTQSVTFVPEGRTIALGQPFSAGWRGLRVSGSVDRVDRGPDGLSLWDYRVGSSPPQGVKNAEGKLSLDVQLPLYQEAVAPSLYPGATVAGARYYSLRKAQPLDVKASSPGQLEELASRLAGHLRSGRYPVDPDVDETACESCDFALLCRTGRRVARKRAAP